MVFILGAADLHCQGNGAAWEEWGEHFKAFDAAGEYVGDKESFKLVFASFT